MKKVPLLILCVACSLVGSVAEASLYTPAAEAANALPRARVHSGNIVSIGYDEKASILEVEFTTGAVYQYYNVPKRIYVGLMNASSHGAYLAQYVKSAGYRYKEVDR